MYNPISKSIIIGKKVVYLPSCHSTNAIAAELVRNAVFENGTVVITNEQTQGRGQRGTTWVSGSGLNLTFSIILRPVDLSVADQFIISQTVAIAVVKYLQGYGQVASIKWPNDIYVGDKKICGTLIENSIQGTKISTSVIGIGLNINQLNFDQFRGTSLALALNHGLNLPDEFSGLVGLLDHYFDLLFNGEHELIRTMYLDSLLGLGVLKQFRMGTEIVYGTITGISKWGRLCFRPHNHLEIKEFDIKEIEWIWED